MTDLRRLRFAAAVRSLSLSVPGLDMHGDTLLALGQYGARRFPAIVRPSGVVVAVWLSIHADFTTHWTNPFWEIYTPD